VDCASPEIIQGAQIALLTTGAGIWLTGCALMALLVAQLPFHAASDALAMQGIMNHVNGGASATPIHVGGHMPNKEKWNELIQAMLRPQKLLGANVRGGGGGGQEDESKAVAFLGTNPSMWREIRHLHQQNHCGYKKQNRPLRGMEVVAGVPFSCSRASTSKASAASL